MQDRVENFAAALNAYVEKSNEIIARLEKQVERMERRLKQWR